MSNYFDHLFLCLRFALSLSARVKPNSITISGRRQVRSWLQTCSELKFDLSSSELARASRSATCLRPDSSRFELSRRVEIARTCSNMVADRFEAKFHYAILVADRSEAGRRPVADLAASELHDRPNSSSLQVCDQLRTCLQPDSVIEFGFKRFLYHIVLNERCKQPTDDSRNYCNTFKALMLKLAVGNTDI